MTKKVLESATCRSTCSKASASWAAPFSRLNVEIADGRLVATTAVNVEAALRAEARLGESEDFRTAKDAAGMPDETGGFLYVNVADAVPLLSLAGLAGAPVPREVTQNLRPLRSVVAWSETDGDRSLSHIFVDIP